MTDPVNSLPGDLTQALRDKLAALRGLLADAAPLVIAVSGGVDSRFLAWCARSWGIEAEAVFLSGPHLTPDETTHARSWLTALGLPWREIVCDPLAEPLVAANGRERCYHCKKLLFMTIAREWAEAGSPGRRFAEGSNASDATTYRPGRRALDELGILHPLADAGLTKAEIREAARGMGLDDPDQPSRSCLMTRFAYDVTPDRETLARVARVEDGLHGLGLTQVRLRLHREQGGDDLTAVLHVDAAQAYAARERKDAVRALLETGGFGAAVVQVDESLSGFFDRTSSS